MSDEFRSKLFETEEKQEFFEDYCVSVLELLDEVDRYIISLDNEIDSISDDRYEGLLLYVNQFMGDMNEPVGGIRECFDRLLNGEISDGEIFYLMKAYDEIFQDKTDIECCLKEYKKTI